MKKRFAKVLVLFTLVIAMVAMTALPAMATTVTVLDGQVSVTDTANSNTVSNGVVTITAKGSIISKKTNTVTITNETASKAKLSFSYTASTYNSFTVDGAAGSASGDFSKILEAGATVTLVLTSNSGLSSTTATLTLSGFSLEPVADVANVTFQYNSTCGSITVGGQAFASGNTIQVDPGVGVAVKATAKSGYSFVGWVDTATGKVLSMNASDTLTPPTDVNVEAVFANTTPMYYVKNSGINYLYQDLASAVSAAQSSDSKTMVLANNATLAQGEYTIPAGITLLIPYNAAHTIYTDEPGCLETYTKPSAYRTLTMANGAKLNVEGSLCVGGQQSAKYKNNGMPTGALAFIKMASGSSITVNNGANLYAWGYITGSGTVGIKAGGTVYECFQVADFRGGDGTSSMATNKYGVFPMSQYYIQNIEVPMTLHAGANEFAYMSAKITGVGIQGTNVPFVGDSDAMFKITSGYVVKDYLEGTGRMKVSSYGDISVSTVSMSMKLGILGETTIDSADFNLPISNHMTIDAVSGKVQLAQNLVMFPGSELYVRENVICNMNSGVRIIVFDLDQWGGYCSASNVEYVALPYVPGGDSVATRLKDALVQIDGTINAANGAIYTTAGGANIYSTGSGKITTTPGAETVTYYAIQSQTSLGTQQVDYASIAIQPILLKNADGSTVNTAEEDGTYTYYASTGRWDRPSHYYEAVVTEPTCVAEGYTTHTCAVCGDSYTDSKTDVTDHTEVIDPAVEATCTQAGATEGSHCSVCGEVIVAQEDILPLPHTEVIDKAVDATCTTDGKTQGSHCSVCNEVMTAQENIPALGHTEEIIEAVAATCTEPGLTEGKSCSACGEVLVAQEDVPASGHSYGDWTTTKEATYTEAGEQTKTCGACGDVVTEGIPVLANPVSTWNIALGDNIGVNFVMTLAEDDAVVVTVNGEEIAYTVSGSKISVNVAAAQMNDVIAISVNGLPLANTYSVRGYADVILKDESKSEYHELVKNMLVYGGAAQTYFGYNSENAEDLASYGIEVTPAAPAGDGTVDVSGSVNGIQFYGAALVHETKTAVRIYFTGSIDGIDFGVYEPVEKNGMYYVEVSGINPQDLGTDVTVVVSNGTDSLTVAYSPLDYIVRMYNKADSSDTTKALVQALYGYYLAAAAYTA